MTATDIHRALMASLFESPMWVYIREFRAGTGWAESANRYLDAWAIQSWPSTGMGVVAIEIKVSRSDWQRELGKPRKRDAALRISNRFYFAAPAGLIHENEVPEECGLIEVLGSMGDAQIKIEAPWRDNLPTWPFVASLARLVQAKQAALTEVGQLPSDQ